MILSDAREGARTADATNCPLNAPANGPSSKQSGAFCRAGAHTLGGRREGTEASGGGIGQKKGENYRDRLQNRSETARENGRRHPGEPGGIGGDNDADKEKAETT